MRTLRDLLLSVAVSCMVLALMLQTINLATQDYRDYRPVLLSALGLMTVADLCWVVIWLLGYLRWSSVVLFALASLFIVLDFLRRAPLVFR